MMRNVRIRSLVTIVLCAAVGVAAVATIVVLGVPRGPGGSRSGAPAAEDLPPFPVVAPLKRAADVAGPSITALPDPAWLTATADATGIPRRALQAYAGAAIAVGDSGTGCDIGWNTLAAIGDIESRHGTIFGGSIDAAGDAVPPIFGVPLAGGGVANIPDTDKGAIDGDATVDRAVGPMQLIPQSWTNWHVDANADGAQNPQNIDDATFAAAHYLCRAGGQRMGTEAGWRTAVLSYNGSDRYLADVIRAATAYAKAAKS